MSGVLYISQTGLMEPLGQSQVLSYLERLAPHYEIHLITFERSHGSDDADTRRRVMERLAASGIAWHPLPYHRRPPVAATAWDIRQGMKLGERLIRRHRLQLVHARSYVPSVIALRLQRRLGVKYLFDMRGFWADERVDGGIWKANGPLYRIAKSFERRFLARADAIVSLTHAAAAALRSRPGVKSPIRVIPTCADLSRFRPLDQGAGHGFVLGYVGTVGTWYMFSEALEAFKLLLERRPDARMLIVNRGEHAIARKAAEAAGVPIDRIEIVSAAHHEVPACINRMSVGVFMARPAYSHVARAPTRLAEFLGCGIPCLSNDGIGDVATILEENQVGIVYRPGDSLAEAMDRLLALQAEPGTAGRCVETARRLFHVDAGAEAYRGIYEGLGVSRRAAP